MSEDHERYREAVLEIVDGIPPGRATTYGAIADRVGRGGPRGVGGVMQRDGAAVAWWRVVRADGGLAAHLVLDAQPHWLIEGTPLRRGVVDLSRAFWPPSG